MTRKGGISAESVCVVVRHSLLQQRPTHAAARTTTGATARPRPLSPGAHSRLAAAGGGRRMMTISSVTSSSPAPPRAATRVAPASSRRRLLDRMQSVRPPRTLMIGKLAMMHAAAAGSCFPATTSPSSSHPLGRRLRHQQLRDGVEHPETCLLEVQARVCDLGRQQRVDLSADLLEEHGHLRGRCESNPSVE